MMAAEIVERPDARRLIAWAAGRRCLLCREMAGVHRPTIVDGARGPRIALIRTLPRVHEFDPGERRRSPR